MGHLLRTGNRAFASLSDALDLGGTEALTGIDLEEGALPVVSLTRSIEQVAVQRTMIVARVDVGAVDGVLNCRPHEDDWTEIYIRGALQDDPALAVVPETHDAWIYSVGGFTTSGGAFTRMAIYRALGSALLGGVNSIFFLATSTSNGMLIQSAGNESALMPLMPLYVPAPAISQNVLTARIVTSAAVSSMIIFDVLSAPRGVLPRIL